MGETTIVPVDYRESEQITDDRIFEELEHVILLLE